MYLLNSDITHKHFQEPPYDVLQMCHTTFKVKWYAIKCWGALSLVGCVCVCVLGGGGEGVIKYSGTSL